MASKDNKERLNKLVHKLNTRLTGMKYYHAMPQPNRVGCDYIVVYREDHLNEFIVRTDSWDELFEKLEELLEHSLI